MLLITLAIIAGIASDCSVDSYDLGSCTSGSIGDSSVILDGSTSTPGGGADTGLETDIDGGGSGTLDDPNTFCEYRAGESYCWSVTPPGEQPASPVTLADIAHFRPQVGSHAMQPGGWVIAGLPANFHSAASTHVVDGSLLGGAASVRFTPVVWHWDYGDGGRASLGSGGASWLTLGLREFDPTPTSHVYAQRGTYSATLTVEFRADYRVSGGPWIPIAGTLNVEAPPLTITATRAQTVLVDRDCFARLTSYGCR